MTGARFGGAAGRRLRQAAPAVTTDLAAVPEQLRDRDGDGEGDRDRPIVGQTGARFPSSAGRRVRDRSTPPDPGPDAVLRPAQPPLAPLAIEAVSAGAGDEAGWSVDESEWELPEETFGLVRPYTWTGGRTTSGQELAMEALISATGRPPDTATSREHDMIVRLCATPRSVAEVAALLSVPLGVARVVLGDMIEAGSIVVHRTASTAGGSPDLVLMQRVLSCLQRL